jgi:hypothetical protein
MMEKIHPYLVFGGTGILCHTDLDICGHLNPRAGGYGYRLFRIGIDVFPRLENVLAAEDASARSRAPRTLRLWAGALQDFDDLYRNVELALDLVRNI